MAQYLPCEGPRDYCGGCDSCERTAKRERFVVARKPRPGILPGDLVCRVTGYRYQRNGPRLGYLRPQYQLVAYGPAHPADKAGKAVAPWWKGWALYAGKRRAVP
jgi:hypothetical protein